MKSSVKSIIIFTSGVATGAISMFFSVKKYFELKADLEIEAVRDAYNRRMEDVEGVKSSIDGDLNGPETIDDGNVERIATRSSIVKELNNKPPLKDYTRYFSSGGEGRLDIKEVSRDPKEDMIEAESEAPPEDTEMTEEEDIEATRDFEMYQINKDHQDALKEDRPPFVIEADDYNLTCAHYAKISLHYYVPDDVLVTDDDELVDISGGGQQLGDCLESSGFLDDDSDVLYVRNDIMMADYEIVKVYTPFEG